MDATEFESNFNSRLAPSDLSPTDAQTRPSDLDGENILIGGWRFNVKSTVFSVSTVNEVIQGWNLIEKNLSKNNISMERLFNPIFRSLKLDYNILFSGTGIMQLDFAIIVLIRLCYWYYKCSSLQLFSIKQNEIREKIQGSLEMIEGTADRDFKSKMDLFRNALEDYLSELMFPSLISTQKKVSFDPKHDFVVEGIPVEVKTIHDRIIVQNDGHGDYYPLVKNEKFGVITTKEEIVEQVTRKKWSDHIGKAIKQGGLMLFVNATSSAIMQDVNALNLINENGQSLEDILFLSFESITKNKITQFPVIVSISAMSYNYQQTNFLVKVPVKEISGKLNLGKVSSNKEIQIESPTSMFNRSRLNGNLSL